MWKKAQVHTRPHKETELESPLEVGRYIDALTRHDSPVSGTTWEYRRYMDGMIAQNPYHLYFTIAENVQPEDHIIEVTSGKMGVYTIDTENGTHDLTTEDGQCYPFETPEYFRKIIATTDSNLWNLKGDGNKWLHIGIAKIPTDFIEAFVREQGKITEVMLKYKEGDEWFNDYTGKWVITNEGFNVRPNGTVIIQPVPQRTFTLEELKQYAFWAVQHAYKLDPSGKRIIHKHEIDTHIDELIY